MLIHKVFPPTLVLEDPHPALFPLPYPEIRLNRPTSTTFTQQSTQLSAQPIAQTTSQPTAHQIIGWSYSIFPTSLINHPFTQPVAQTQPTADPPYSWSTNSPFPKPTAHPGKQRPNLLYHSFFFFIQPPTHHHLSIWWVLSFNEALHYTFVSFSFCPSVSTAAVKKLSFKYGFTSQHILCTADLHMCRRDFHAWRVLFIHICTSLHTMHHDVTMHWNHLSVPPL